MLRSRGSGRSGETYSKQRNLNGMGSGGLYDVVVVGAGFGGLGAAVRLGELGAKVALVEAVNYPGGCAATFSRGGFQFEAGATLSSGLAEDQLFGKWIRRYDLPVESYKLDPVIEMRLGNTEPLGLRSDKTLFVQELCRREPGHAEGIRKFFSFQSKVADAFWPLFEDPGALPPLGPHSMVALIPHLDKLVAKAPLLHRGLHDVLRRHRLQDCASMTSFIDALCQITVQCSSKVAAAPIALSALDFPWRGSSHVVGGIGNLAHGLVQAAEALGIEIGFSERAKGIRKDGDGFVVETRRRTLRSRRLILNLIPSAAAKLFGQSASLLEVNHLAIKREAQSWGALMKYAVVVPPKNAPDKACHLQLVDDTCQAFHSGNHVFLSISDASENERCPAGQRTITASTHFALSHDGQKHFDLPEADQAIRVESVRARMMRTIQKRAPEWFRQVQFELLGSPRTFARFTNRTDGRVGGPPRTSGVLNVLRSPNYEMMPGVFLVGDCMSPGQSTYACAVGGIKVVELLQRLR